MLQIRCRNDQTFFRKGAKMIWNQAVLNRLTCISYSLFHFSCAVSQVSKSRIKSSLFMKIWEVLEE
jgi:hypothetical protein